MFVCYVCICMYVFAGKLSKVFSDDEEEEEASKDSKGTKAQDTPSKYCYIHTYVHTYIHIGYMQTNIYYN